MHRHIDIEIWGGEQSACSMTNVDNGKHSQD